MTILDDRYESWGVDLLGPREVLRQQLAPRRSAAVVRPAGRSAQVRPGPVRPSSAPMAYRGTGTGVSRAPHLGHRPVSTSATVAVAVMSALITLWLGWLAHLGGGSTAAAGGGLAVAPEQLAVVHVQSGETLQHLAGRMVPDAPVAQVVERIRALNNLDSSSLETGQTLIAPVG